MVKLASLDDRRLIDLLEQGSVGVMPTDTIYGLACRANNQMAVEKLYQLKHRDTKPGTVIAASIDQLTELGVTRRYLKAVEHFWPNPISIVLPIPETLSYLSLGLTSLPFRVIASKQLQNLLIATGPLLTTSANLPNQPPATNSKSAKGYFGDKVDFYVEGGDLSNHQPSTIIKVIDDAIEVIRSGAVPIDENGQIPKDYLNY